MHSLFGFAVAVDGDTLLTGATDAAYVFTRSAGVWTQQAILTGGTGENFGRNVDLAGDDAIVSEESDDAPQNNSGSAHVFTRVGSTWSLQQKLVPSDPVVSGQFGQAVAIDADNALVRHGATPRSVYTFSRAGTVWTQGQKLNVRVLANYSVAIDGTRGLRATISVAVLVPPKFSTSAPMSETAAQPTEIAPTSSASKGCAARLTAARALVSRASTSIRVPATARVHPFGGQRSAHRLPREQHLRWRRRVQAGQRADVCRW